MAEKAVSDVRGSIQLAVCMVVFLLHACATGTTLRAGAKPPTIPPGTSNQNPGAGKLLGQTLRIKRVMLLVQDLKRSLEFYENVLGLEVYAVDQEYSYDTDAIGRQIFNTAYGTRKRVATLNTSSEVRGIALREVDAGLEVPQSPRNNAILLEASDLLDIVARAKAAGVTVIEPRLGFVPAKNGAPELRYMECAILDPDGHTLALFRYFGANEDAAWEAAQRQYRLEQAGD